MNRARRDCGVHEPWRPQQLALMLQDYAGRLQRGETYYLREDPLKQLQYNELILDSATWVAHLPRTIEAFFFPDTPECATPLTDCQSAVRGAHSRFRRQYGAAVPVPLLRLRLDGRLPAFEVVA